MPLETKPSFEEVMRLGQLLGQSFALSESRAKEVLGFGKAMAQEVVTPVIAECLRHEVVSEAAIMEELERIMEHAYVWNFACFGIGVEQGAGNFGVEAGMRYLGLICRAYGIHLVYFLEKLVDSGVMSQEEALGCGRSMIEKVQEWVVRIDEFGREQPRNVKRRGSGFLSAVKELERADRP